MITLALNFYNMRRWVAKDHKIYFITMDEYKKDFNRMNWSYIIKAIVYACFFATGLILLIVKGVAYFRYPSKLKNRKKKGKTL